MKDFVARHRAVFKADAGSHAALNFTGLNAVAAAMRLAGTAIYEGHPRPGRGRGEAPVAIVPLDAARTGG